MESECNEVISNKINMQKKKETERTEKNPALEKKSPTSAHSKCKYKSRT